MTKLRLRTKVNFPANVTGDGGIAVRKTAGEWVIYPKFSDLVSIPASSVTDPATQQIWLYNPSADTYAVLTLAGLGDALFKLTSTTSNSIGTGTKTFTVQQNKDVGIGQYVIITDDAAPSTNYMIGQITAYSGTSMDVNVTTTGGSGTKTAWTIRVGGATGATGATGERAGFKYTFNSATSGDPGSGKFLFNNATFASATSLNISETDGESINLASLLTTLDDSTNTIKCLMAWINADGSKGFLGYLTGTITDAGAYDTFSFTPITSWGSPANNDVFRLQPLRVGDKGADGTLAASGTPTVGQFGVWVTATSLKGVSLNGIVKGNGASDPTVAGTGDTLTIGTIELGAASDTTLSRTSAGVIAVEGVNLTPNIPQNAQSAAYTLVLADANTSIHHPIADNNARTFTIPANASVAYPIGTTLTFTNAINTVTISINSDTLVLAGTSSTGSRTLAVNGIATAVKITSTAWLISGAGLS